MLTIKWYLAANGSTQVLDKNFPVYQGQYQNILLNVFVPTTLLAPNFTTYASDYQNVITPYVAGSGVKVGAVVTDYDGAIKSSKEYFCRYIKTLVKDNVEYALFERKLPQEFTMYAAEGVMASLLIANVVNVKYGQITEATATAANSTLNPTVNVATLSTVIPAVSQNYTFIYRTYSTTAQGTTGWYLNSELVRLSHYGIKLAESASPSDADTIVLSVIADKPTVLRIATSQTYPFEVLQSDRLLDDELLEATDLEEIQAQLQSIQQTLAEKQDILDNSLQTQNKTVPTAINENRQNILKNSGEIANNTADISDVKQELAELQGQLENGTDYLGTMTIAENLPTDEELLAFAKQQRGTDYALKNQDVIIVIVTHADATDENYKYTYNYYKTSWDYFKIPPMEKASNGTFGIVQGTYGTGSTNNILVDIVGGEISKIYVKQSDGTYVTLDTLLNTIATNFADIASGQTQVGFAKKAEQDGNGANIAVTYLTKTLGATKQYVRDYALPNEFNDVSYYTKDGFVDEVPTEPTEIQNVASIAGIAQTPIFSQAAKSFSDIKFELSSKNSFNSKYYVSTNKDATVTFTLLTYARIDGEVKLISSTVGEPVQLQTDVIKSIAFVDNFSLIGKDVLHINSGDAILQTLLVTPSASDSDRTITIYSGETYPSTFYLYTSTTTLVQGSLSDLDNISFPYGEPTVTYDTTDGIRVSGIFRFTAGTTDTDVPFDMEIPIVAGTHLVADATDENTHVVIKVDSDWEKTIQNAYLQPYESATVPTADQVLTLTNANFARTPIVGQKFQLTELVNTKDTYINNMEILTVGATTCTAKITSFTDVTSGKLDKVTATSVQVYATSENGQTTIGVGSGGGAIPLRDSNGNLTVPNATADGQAVNKGQMDTAIAAAQPYHIILSSDSGTITQEQYSALLADKYSYVIVKENTLYRATSSGAVLRYGYANGYRVGRLTIDSDLTYSYYAENCERTNDKVSAITTDNTNTTNYPNTQAVVDYVDAQIGNINTLLTALDTGTGV